MNLQILVSAVFCFLYFMSLRLEGEEVRFFCFRPEILFSANLVQKKSKIASLA